jgi:hypothetical protein
MSISPGKYNIKACSNGKWVTRDGAGYFANRDVASTWEVFELEESGGKWRIKDYQGGWWGIGAITVMTPSAFYPSQPDDYTFDIEDKGEGRYAFKGTQVNPDKYVTAEPSWAMAGTRTEANTWEMFELTAC